MRAAASPSNRYHPLQSDVPYRSGVRLTFNRRGPLRGGTHCVVSPSGLPHPAKFDEVFCGGVSHSPATQPPLQWKPLRGCFPSN